MADVYASQHKVHAYLDSEEDGDTILWEIGDNFTCYSDRISEIIAAIHACRRSLAHQLYAEGWSKRQIGLALAVGRRTIQLWLKDREES